MRPAASGLDIPSVSLVPRAIRLPPRRQSEISLTNSSTRPTRATFTLTGDINRLIHQMKTATFLMDNGGYPRVSPIDGWFGSCLVPLLGRHSIVNYRARAASYPRRCGRSVIRIDDWPADRV